MTSRRLAGSLSILIGACVLGVYFRWFHSRHDTSTLDTSCPTELRAAAVVPEELLGTTDLASRLIVGKAQQGAPDTITVYVRIRKCPRSDQEEYETWVPRSSLAAGASTWVPLYGSFGNLESVVWFVGKREGSEDSQLPRELFGATPERRVVRLHFPKRLLVDVEAGRIGRIQVSKPVVKWLFTRKGESITSADGKKHVFSEDLVGPDVSLTITNHSAEPSKLGYPNDFYLAGKDNSLISARLSCDRCSALRSEESRIVTLTPYMIRRSEVTEFAPVYLVNLRTGLRLSLPPLN